MLSRGYRVVSCPSKAGVCNLRPAERDHLAQRAKPTGVLGGMETSWDGRRGLAQTTVELWDPDSQGAG